MYIINIGYMWRHHPHQRVGDTHSVIGKHFKDEQNVKQMLTKWTETSTNGWEIAENWTDNWDSSNPYQDLWYLCESNTPLRPATIGVEMMGQGMLLSPIEEMLVRWELIPRIFPGCSTDGKKH